MPNSKGYTKIESYRYCPRCSPVDSNSHIQTYVLNTVGNTIEIRGIKNGNINGLVKVSWKGSLFNSYQNYNTFSYSGFTAETAIETWEKDSLSQEVNYEYNEDSLLSKISWFNGNSRFLSFEIVYLYDNMNRVIKETYTYFPDETIAFGFKSNSIETVDIPESERKIIKTKTYTYKADTVEVIFTNEGVITGKGIMIYVNNYKTLLKESIFNSEGKLIYSKTYNYNDKNQLIKETCFDTGRDGFGGYYDYIGNDTVLYEYSKNGILIKREEYFKSNLALIINYKYYK